MLAPLVLRVFLSSPGDVVEERKLALDTLQALEGSHLLKGKMRFEIVTWGEHAWDDVHAAAPMNAGETPQVSLNRRTGRPADCDLTLVILWSRMGTRLPPGLTRPDGSRYESGTVWEYEDALAANKLVFVYCRTEKPKIDLDDAEFDKKRAQYAAVKAFVGQFENPDGSLRVGFTTYAAPADFGKILRLHLEGFVKERMAAKTPAAAAQIDPDNPMTAKFFISYRRDDSAGHAGRVQDRLEKEFGRDVLFMDVDAIPLGINFVKVLREAVAKCGVFLAVIGPRWLDARDEDGNRRLDDPNDPVRIEVAAALQRDIPVIPILLDGARIPKANMLPKELEELALRNGLDVRHSSFHNDMNKLVRELKRQSSQAVSGSRRKGRPA